MDDISSKLNKKPYDLLIKLSEELTGERVSRSGMGIIESEALQEARILSHYWIDDWFTVIWDIICIKGKFCEKVGKLEILQIAVALADLIAPKFGAPPAATLASLIVTYGVSRFCRCSQETSGVKEDFLGFLPSWENASYEAEIKALTRVAILHYNAKREELALIRLNMAKSILENEILQKGKVPIGTDEGDLINSISYEYINCGKPGIALTLLHRASKVMKKNIPFLDTLGWAYFQTGDNKKAIKHLQEACRLDANWSLDEGSSEIRYHFLNALMKDGKTNEAKKILVELERENDSDWIIKVKKLFPALI